MNEFKPSRWTSGLHVWSSRLEHLNLTGKSSRIEHAGLQVSFVPYFRCTSASILLIRMPLPVSHIRARPQHPRPIIVADDSTSRSVIGTPSIKYARYRYRYVSDSPERVILNSEASSCRAVFSACILFYPSVVRTFLARHLNFECGSLEVLQSLTEIP
jgi:hypothetical protein